MKARRDIPIIQFTKEGYEAAKKKYEALLAERKPAVEDLKKAREMGDLSENGWYKAAKFKLGFIDRQLRELKIQLQYGKVIARSKHNTVGVGSSVLLDDGKHRISYHIVGEFEANPAERKLSLVSPIGKALVGKRRGETVVIHAPVGRISYTVVDIS